MLDEKSADAALILIGMLSTVIGGLIPARAAAGSLLNNDQDKTAVRPGTTSI